MGIGSARHRDDLGGDLRKPGAGKLLRNTAGEPFGGVNDLG
jgi:hypothetical protein